MISMFISVLKMFRSGLLLVSLPISTFGLELDDITDKSKPIFTDIAITAQHQYYIGTRPK